MPHVEEKEILIDEVMDANLGRLGHRIRILGTSHKPNRGSLTSAIAHTLVKLYPDKYHEVVDKKGGVCHPVFAVGSDGPLFKPIDRG